MSPSSLRPRGPLQVGLGLLALTLCVGLPGCGPQKGGQATFSRKSSLSPFLVTGNPPQAKLDVSPSSGTAPLTVSFDASGSSADSASTLVGWSVDFGDGSPPGLEALGQHTYLLPGGYRLTATVTDAEGRTGEAEATVSVGLADGTKPPSAKISASATSGTAPLLVDLGCDCQAGSSHVKTVSWSLDGERVDGWEAHPTFTAGVHTVGVTATDEAGLTATDSLQVIVTGTGDATPPGCHLYASPASGPAPLTVTYQAQTQAGTGSIQSQVLTFSDGTSQAADSTVSRTLSAPGREQATLTVTDSNGMTCTAQVEATATSTDGSIPPRIVSAPPAGPFDCGVVSYVPYAAGTQPIQWSLTTTADGVAVDPGTGLLTLDPNVASTADVTLAATNAAGHDAQAVHLDLNGCALKANVGGCTAGAPLSPADALALTPALLWLLSRRRRRA